MAFITFIEIIDVVIMTLLLGYLFKDVIRPTTRTHGHDDVLSQYTHHMRKAKRKLFDDNFWFTTAIVAPSVILHELAHKFTALAYGLSATFHAFYANGTTLMLGVFAIAAKLMGFAFFFIVPGFVSISGLATPMQSAVIAFMGPAVHLVFWLAPLVALKNSKHLTMRQKEFLYLTKQINMVLFIVNMLPIPGIDGFSIYANLWKAIG